MPSSRAHGGNEEAVHGSNEFEVCCSIGDRAYGSNDNESVLQQRQQSVRLQRLHSGVAVVLSCAAASFAHRVAGTTTEVSRTKHRI